MRRIRHTVTAISAALLLNVVTAAGPHVVAAGTADAPSLTISQLKVTSSNGQFVTLYNATDETLDMSKYQLQYFNSYDLSKATSSKLIALSGNVPPHGYYMVNDSNMLLCYRLTVDSVSLGFSSTAGFIQVLKFNQTVPSGLATPIVQDYVGWSKAAAAGAQTLPAAGNAFLQRLDNSAVSVPGGGGWQTVQPDAMNPCNLITVSGGPMATGGPDQLLPSTEPPATIISLDAASAPQGPYLPAADVGLMAPQITELLPNPEGTGNDSTDEFIEIYNPNSASFDLTNFSLQTGLSTTRSYAFPAGTTLAPGSFTVFYSASTGLSLSNSGSQVKLLDPFGNAVSAAEVYGAAKDDEAWALAKGKWYWTVDPTPGKTNTIKQAVSKKSSSSSKSQSTKSTGTAAIRSAAKTSGNAAGEDGSDNPLISPVHVRTLALVGALALLYGAYEYRTDLGNRIYQFRQYIRNRGFHRT
jgi:hypothetical protein